jgi:hypothetical protein
MKLLAIVAFNLKGAESDDYGVIRDELHEMGLAEEVRNENNIPYELPDTTYLGIVESPSAKILKDKLVSRLKKVFQDKGIRATYVISVAKDFTLTMGQSR